MTDAQQPVWIKLWNDYTASWSDDGNALFLPGDTGKPFMEVKPCPECAGTGRCKEWPRMDKAERMAACLITCPKCKDGWVIA